MNQPINKAIECSVTQCAHHCDLANYCTLNKIKVGAMEGPAGQPHCTDCQSYTDK